MENRIFILVISLFSNIILAQVGINTTDPKATLDINGDLKIRTLNTVNTILTTEQVILLRDKSTAGAFVVKEVRADVLLDSHAYYASKSGSWSLLALALGSSWYKINITGANDTKVGRQSLFTDGVYTAPQKGVYAINYEFQMASGVNLELLGGKKLGIIKNNTIVWDEKIFDGIRISLDLGLTTLTIAAIPVTSTSLTSMVQLNAGETITFAVNTSGVLPVNLGVLTSGKVNINIYKISSQ